MRTLFNFLAVFFSVQLLFAGWIAHADEDLPPAPGKPYILMDASTGAILDMEQPFLRWAPASLTKMMTAYTVFRQIELQHIDLKSPVRVSKNALKQPPSKMGMPVGTIMTVEAALNIIMVKSANDISVALAESVAGSERNFIDLMNAHARRLGMVDTNFENPHGLPHRKQYTSAHDMAVLAKTITEEFRKHDRFFNIPGIRIGKRRLRNHNALVERFPGTNGMKTGFVCASGYNVVVRTEREGRELIAVVLGGKSGLARNVKAAKLLQEGFDGTLKGNGVTLSSLERPADNSETPTDITIEICRGKYNLVYKAQSVVPKPRPSEAPDADEFDKIDTALVEAPKAESDAEQQEKAVIIPSKRPAFVAASASPATTALGEEKKAKPVIRKKAEKKLSVREMAAIYLTPRKRPREDVKVSLGGAIGRNPNGIKHTDGGRYVKAKPKPAKSEEKTIEKAEAVSEKPQQSASVAVPEKKEPASAPKGETAQNAAKPETDADTGNGKSADVAAEKAVDEDLPILKAAVPADALDPAKVDVEKAPIPTAAADGEMKPVNAALKNDNQSTDEANPKPIPTRAIDGEMVPLVEEETVSTPFDGNAPVPRLKPTGNS